MKRKSILTAAILSSSLLLAACGQQSDNGNAGDGLESKPMPTYVDTSKVLATVNGDNITQMSYDHFAESVGLTDKEDDPKVRETLINEMVKRKLLAQFALERKLEEQPEVAMALEEGREAILDEAAVKELQTEVPPVTEADAKARYEQELKNSPKEEYKVRHILVASKEEAEKLIKELQDDPKADFAEMAKKHSTGPSNKNGGELGWIRKGMVVPEFADGMEKLKAGEISKEPVKTQYGWHVIDVEETRPIELPKFDQVKDKIIALMKQEQLQHKLNEMRAAANIKLGSDEVSK